VPSLEALKDEASSISISVGSCGPEVGFTGGFQLLGTDNTLATTHPRMVRRFGDNALGCMVGNTEIGPKPACGKSSGRERLALDLNRSQ